MKAFRPSLAALAAIAAILPLAGSANVSAGGGAGDQVALGEFLSPPAALSTSGDYATDMFSDPWDFSNDADIVPIPGVGAFRSDAVNIDGGVLTAATRDAAELRLLMNWSMGSSVLPGERDGWKHPIDANAYTQTTFRLRADANLSMSVRWFNAGGETGVIPFQVEGGDWKTFHFDLTDRKNYPFPGSDAVWGGTVVRYELFRTGTPSPVNVQLDWVRLHRPDASREPVTNVAIPQVITPNERGGVDYATAVRGNAWDFAGLDDVGETHDVSNLRINADGDLQGFTTGNDGFIGLPLGPTLNTDRYHHLSIDICQEGPFSLADAAGGGMNGRMAWIPHGTLEWTSTQDFIVYPGCQTIMLDLVTDPAGSLNDESAERPTGWRGVRIDALRFDINEDRGRRAFTLRNISLSDDAAFSGSTAINFRDAAGVAGTKADIFVTTNRGDYNGTRVAHDINVTAGDNSFNWNGNDERGNTLPNATYWAYVVMKSPAGTGVGYSSGTVRLERAVSSAASYFVPLTPERLLDTRSGVGGNIFPLVDDTFTELNVTGVGGVPLAGVTAVVMNVTATNTSASGYLTAWPSGEPRPLVSNVNFVPGQTVPNLVTVKVGANGRVNLYNSAGHTDVLADVAGYYTTIPPQSGGRFTALTPTRLLDTRDGTGGTSGPLGLNGQTNLTVTGVGGVPSTGVSAVALNVTVDQPTGSGFLTVWPAGEARPTASTHNYEPTLTVANLVLAKVGANGQVSIFNSAGQTHVVADVIGYFSSTGGLFVPVTPQRVVDSRDTTGNVQGSLDAQSSRSLNIATGNPVPGSAAAAVVNVTSVDATSPSYITVWPSGAARPLASTLNPRPGVAVPNQAYLRLGGGKLDVFNAAGSTNVVVDVFGYITAP